MTRAAAGGAAVGASRGDGSPAARAPSRALPDSYLHQSELPLTSLVFLLPFVVLYEVGTAWFASDRVHHSETRIVAFTLLQHFFAWFGASGRYLPAMAIVCVLLAWHVARNDPWRVRPSTLLTMALESVIWAVPLVLLGQLTTRWFTHRLPLWSGSTAAVAPHTPGWQSLFVLALGAGIYEELMFRLIAFTALNVLLVDVLRLTKPVAYLGIVLSSATTFSLYHYLGWEQPSWQSFVFRMLAGTYFGLLFLTRGFGITAFSHFVYDVIVLLA